MIYITQLRDAYSHLVEIFDYDNILDGTSKERIKSHLDRYSGHVERILLDTYRKISSEKIRLLYQILPPNDIGAVKVQVATRLKELRVVDASYPNDRKIDGYSVLIKFIEDIFDKFYNKVKQ